MINDFMKLEDAVEIVLEAARSCLSESDLVAAATVEDFFVNNVFDGT